MKAKIYNHKGGLAEIEVDAVLHILYVLRPKLPDETPKHRVEMVEKAEKALDTHYLNKYLKLPSMQDEAPKPNPKAKDIHERMGTCWACYEESYCRHEIRDDLRQELKEEITKRLKEGQDD